LLKKVRTLGIGFVFERVFERIVPAWLFRFSSVAVYQLDFDRFSGDPFSAAAVKICDGEHELEQLRQITSVASTTGVLATIDGEAVGGLGIALSDYEDRDLGLSFLLGDQGAWILMAQSAKARKNAGLAAPFIGVSSLNKASHKAIKRFGAFVGKVLVIRVGSMAWARSTGDLKQNQNLLLFLLNRNVLKMSGPPTQQNESSKSNAALTKDLNQPLRKRDVLTPSMRKRLVDQQCAREQTLPHASALTRIVEQFNARPHDLAISTFDGPSVTYSELGQRVRQLAQTLVGCGVQQGDIVAIHMERSIEALISMLAINTAGAAFLPLDVSSPLQRRVFMLQDARVKLILVDNSENLDTDIQKLRVDQDFDGSFNHSFQELPSEPAPPDGLAYVIYTSGSTGNPKGVCIEHGSLANHIAQIEELYELTSEDRSIQLSSLAFDSAMEEIFATLALGASVWLHSQIDWPESIRVVSVGGERVDPRLHARFRELVSDRVRFINCYGPTETTIACTFYDDAEGDHDSTVLPIGRPRVGTSCFVLDGARLSLSRSPDRRAIYPPSLLQ